MIGYPVEYGVKWNHQLICRGQCASCLVDGGSGDRAIRRHRQPRDGSYGKSVLAPGRDAGATTKLSNDNFKIMGSLPRLDSYH